MPYDEKLAKRVRKLFAQRKGFEEKKMFGGIALLHNGNMCVAVWTNYLILRVGMENYEKCLTEEGMKEFDLTGRSMRGWVMAKPELIATEDDLKFWSKIAVKFVKTLPAK
ncbi:hypothetical protein MNBD_PLANCTO02-1890 [hydrothermal vent metagenome]|uniref:TfoX N-terminal domain-containing protein n=1 Tax=hydrothermal vent metagenome TaxID=652676 RepID=A0A3B1DW27_9ZZZZ